MRYGVLLTPHGPRPYASIGLGSRSHRTQNLTPGESMAFAGLFMAAVVVTIVIVMVVL